MTCAHQYLNAFALQGLGSSSPLLQLEARLQASKIRQAQMEAQVQERGDKIRQLEVRFLLGLSCAIDCG